MFSASNNEQVHKSALDVSITLINERMIEGSVFVTLKQRVSDLLNDDRKFVPVDTKSGETVIIAKTQIASIVEAPVDLSDEEVVEEEETKQKPNKEKPRRSSTMDPFEILRVSPNATLNEIRAAYKKRIKSVHPDRVASMGLDEDLAQAALKSTQKLNYAYRKIVQEYSSNRGDSGAA